MDRSERQAADGWILARCGYFEVIGPTARATIISAECSDAGAMFVLIAGADRGWTSDGDLFLAVEDGRVALGELRWLRRLAWEHGFRASLRVCVSTVLDCDFDTATNAAAFMKHFHAEAL